MPSMPLPSLPGRPVPRGSCGTPIRDSRGPAGGPVPLMFRRVAGRPVLAYTDRAAQRRRTMSRCQRRIVSGVTSSRRPWRRALGITPSRAASRARSAQFSFGRRDCWRWRTATWWRRIKISAVFHASSRRESCSPAASRLIRRNTNRRHVIADHHGRTAGEQLRWSEPWTRFSARTGRVRGGTDPVSPHCSMSYSAEVNL